MKNVAKTVVIIEQGKLIFNYTSCVKKKEIYKFTEIRGQAIILLKLINVIEIEDNLIANGDIS